MGSLAGQSPAEDVGQVWVETLVLSRAAVHSLASSSSLPSASLLTSLSFSSLSSSCESSCDSWRPVCSSDGNAMDPAAADTAADVVAAGSINCCSTGWSSACCCCCTGWTLCWCSRSCCSWGWRCISGCDCGSCGCSCGGCCCSSCCCGRDADGSQLYADVVGILDEPAATSSKRGFLAPPDYRTYTD